MHRVGRKLPCHVTALGQALLAELTTSEVREMLPAKLERFTENSIVDIDDLVTELGEVRNRGWPWNENRDGRRGVYRNRRALPNPRHRRPQRVHARRGRVVPG